MLGVVMGSRLALVALMAVSGCAYGGRDLYLPPEVPAFSSVDVVASEVVLYDLGDDLDIDTAAQLRRAIAEVLEEGARERDGTQGDASADGRGPARFLVTATILEATEGPHWIPFVGFATLMGATTFHAKVRLAVTIQTAAGRVTGTATAKDGGSLYASVLERTVVLAMQQALTNARRVAEGGPR